MLIALHIGGAGARVRSHFQRLVLVPHLIKVRHDIVEKERAEVEAQREHERMSAEDATSRMCMQWTQALKERERMSAEDATSLMIVK